jgi:(p)ppGpp synthase/HD superfamily hydrolase
MILDRAGFDEDVVIAGVLHDVVEDTAATCADITQRFGPWAADLVRQCSEIKTDAQGRKRPWIDRKRDHLAALAKASMAVRGVILADKLHNLISIELDLDEGRPVWSLFNADRSRVLWYYQATIETCDGADPRVHALATMCREVLTRIESRG